MNYISNENCLFDEDGNLLSGFTCGQKVRMYMQWKEYREHVQSCPTGEMEVEFLYQISAKFAIQDQSVLRLTNKDSDSIVYDSTSLDTEAMVCGTQKTLVVDLCLPEANYEFTISDSGGNGLDDDAFLEIRVNGALVSTIEGNFGSVATVELPNPGGKGPGTEVPTDAPTRVQDSSNSSYTSTSSMFDVSLVLAVTASSPLVWLASSSFP